MRSLRIFCPVLFLLLQCFNSDAAVRDFTPKPPRNERELIVKFRKGASAQEKARVLKNASTVKQVPLRRGLRAAGAQPGAPGTLSRISIPEGTPVDGELARLQSNPSVEYVEPNYSIHITTEANATVLPNDFEFEFMYSLQNLGGDQAKTNADISAPEAWAFGTGSRSMIVAVIDTGIDYLHDDLKDNLWINPREVPFNGIDDDGNGFVDDVNGYDFIWNDSDPFDDNQHGTHVCGIIGAKGNNGVGTVGVCWNVSLMALKTFDESGNGSVADAIAAITYAVENGARIINASWTLEERSRALEEAAQYAADAGVLIVAAAGNNHSELPYYPAAFESVVAVAATDARDNRADFSNYGPHVDVAAPGANILSTLPENSYGVLSGTSMASPHVAGVAALVLSRFPMYSRQELFDILVNSVDTMVFDVPIGNGRINAAKAIQMDQPLPTARISVAETVSGVVSVKGTAAGTFFSGYSLNIGSGRAPAAWIPISSSLNTLTNSILGQFDSSIVPDGYAVVQLVVSNLNGASAVATAPVRVFNGLITYPLSADVLAPGKYTVRGTVHGTGKSYELLYGAGMQPTSWNRIAIGGTGKLDAPLGEWDATDLPTGYYTLRLTISHRGERSNFDAPMIYINSSLKPGWPAYVPTDSDFPATEWRNIRPADLDGDGLSEFVLVDAGTRNHPQVLRVYSLNGTELWTRDLGYDIPPDMPAIADVDGDGKKEIFVDGTNGILAFRFNGVPLPGWPVTTGSANHAKVLADVDGDGTPELIAYSQEYAATQVAENRELFVFKCDGALLRKWVLPWCGFTNDVQKIYPAVGNLDDDAALEIVVPSGCSELVAFDLENQSPKWSAPVTGKMLSSPVIGDVDGNGQLDIVLAVTAARQNDSAGVYLFDHNGRRWTGWPNLEEFSFVNPPALADLDQDGRLEIVLVEDQVDASVHVVQFDGFEADGWPLKLFQKTSSRVGISIADVNNDGRSEIITATPGYLNLAMFGQNADYVGGIAAHDFAGNIIPLNTAGPLQSVPFESSGQPRYHKSGPAILTDVDSDGRLDLVHASIQDRTYGSLAKLKNRSSLYVSELANPGRVEWPMLGYDVANSGAYSLPLPPTPVPTNITRAIRDRVITFEERELRMNPTTNDWNATSEPLTIIGLLPSTNSTVSLEGQSTVIYRPRGNFAGLDKFSYIIRDALGATSSAPVIVRVKALNDAPVASNIDLTINKNSSADVIYEAQDPENEVVTFRIAKPPQHGELWNYPNVGTYYPAPGYSGTDSFSYIANDGRTDSAEAFVIITILNSNNPPEAISQSLLTKTNRSLLITPSGSDMDRDPLTYEIVSPPALGTVEREGSVFRFTPPQDYLGTASFTYRAFDGTAFSDNATISISVIATNAAPGARDGSATIQPDTATALRLSGFDPDGDAFEYEVVTAPLHGQLSGTPPNLVYLPNTNYLGPDRFEFRVSDGFAVSEPATFLIQVMRQNRPPIALEQFVRAELNTAARFGLNASDPDGDPVRVIILKGPGNGILSGSGTNIIYAPRSAGLNSDSFTYKLWDGQRFGNVARVSLNFSPVEEKAPAFSTIQNINGIVELRLKVTALKPFRIEASSNLSDWFVVVPRTTTASETFQFTDENAPAGMRYYRAVRE